MAEPHFSAQFFFVLSPATMSKVGRALCSFIRVSNPFIRFSACIPDVLVRLTACTTVHSDNWLLPLLPFLLLLPLTAWALPPQAA